MANNAMTSTNIAPYIPEMWSLKVKSAYENALVIASHCDRRYQEELKYGDTLNVPNLSNMGTASTVSLTADITLYEIVQNTDAIIVNYQWYKAVGEGFMEMLQDRPDFLEASLSKCVYSVASMLDNTISYLVNSLTTNTAGTEGDPLKVATFIDAYEGLNENDVPDNDRVWILDPESITDILGTDYFVRMDYVAGSIHTNGFQGRQILGAPVYMTNALNVINTSYHAAVYFQKDWVAIIQQLAPTIFTGDWWQKFTKVTGVKTLVGLKQMREPNACWIKTRS